MPESLLFVDRGPAASNIGTRQMLRVVVASLAVVGASCYVAPTGVLPGPSLAQSALAQPALRGRRTGELSFRKLSASQPPPAAPARWWTLTRGGQACRAR